jgi:5,10-methenyltetrahydromethanopterin hydrogenase
MNDFTPTTLGIISALVLALVAVIGKLYVNVIASKDALLKDMKAQRDAYQEMAAENLEELEKQLNIRRRDRGEEHMEVMAPVEAEHHSPTTERQHDTAELATLRARQAAVKKELERKQPT